MFLNLAAVSGLVLGLGLLLYGALAWRRSRRPFGPALRVFLSPPLFPDMADNRRAGLLAALVQPVTAAVLIVVPIMAVLRRDESSFGYLVLGIWSFDANVLIYFLARRGRLSLACWLYPAVMFALGTVAVLLGGGNAGLATYAVTIVVGGLLLGGAGTLVYALLSSLMWPAILFGKQLGLIHPAIVLTSSEWLEYVAVYFVTAILLRLLTQRFEASIRHAGQLQAQEAERSRALDQSLRLERKRAQQLELLAESARRVTGINDPQALLDEATRRVVEAFNFEHAAVFLVEDERLVVHSARGALSAARPLGSALNLGQGVVGAVGRSGETCWVRTAEQSDYFPPVTGFTVTSVVAIPLRLAKSVVGVLEVASTKAEAIEATDVRTLESLADLIAAGLQASQLFLQLRSRQQTSEALRRIGAAVNQSLDLSQIVSTVCKETSPAFDADRVEVWLVADGSPVRLQRAAECSPVGQEAADLTRRETLLQDYLGSSRARLLLTDNGAAGPHDWLGRSAIIVPLNGERRSLGLLSIEEWHRLQPYTNEDAASAEFLGDHLAAAVANARLYADDRRRADELALLSDVTSASLEIKDYTRLLETLADRLSELIEADGCVLAVWDTTQQSAQLAAVSGELDIDGTAAGSSVAAAVPLTEPALKAGRAVVVSNGALPTVASGSGLSASAILSLPLIANAQWLGAAHLTYFAPRVFSDDDIAYAERAGRQIALAMSKARALDAERRRNAELEALHAASLRVTSSLDLEAVLESILQQALSLAGGEDAHIFLYDGERLTFGAALWANGVNKAPFAVPRSGGLTDAVAQSGQRIVVPDENRHPLYQAWQWGGAIVGLPLRSGDRICGVMNVAFAQPRQFDDNELRLLDLLADQAAVALENARLFNAEREQRELAEALRAASQVLSSTLEFDAVLDRLLDQIERVVPFDAAAILLVNNLSPQARVARSRGYEAFGAAGAWLSGATFDLASTANLRLMAETRRPLLVADTAADPAWSMGSAAEQLHSWAGVPIVAHQQVIAFFTLDKAVIGFYRQEHADRLAAFAGQAALALQNARLFEAERRRAAQLALLSEVSQQVTGTLDESQLLQRVVQAMISQLGFAEATIMLPVSDQELEIVAVATTEQMTATVGYRQRVGAGVIGHAVELGATYLTNDVGLDPYYFDPDGRAVGSALALPLKYEAKILAVLYLESSTPGAFNSADVVAYKTLANHIATALQNARLFAAQRRRTEEQRLLLMAARDFSAALSEAAVLQAIARHVTGALEAPSCTISQWDRPGDALITLLDYQWPDDSPADAPGTIYALAEYRASRWVLLTRQPLVVDADDPHADPTERNWLNQRGQARQLMVPLYTGEDVFGLIEARRGHGSQPFSEADQQLALSLAAQAAVALENAQLHSAVKENVRELDALLKANAALLSTLDLDPLLHNILSAAIAAIPSAEMGSIAIDDPASQTLRIRATYGYHDERIRSVALPKNEGYGPRAARENRPLLIHDVRLEAPLTSLEAIAELETIASAIVAPLAAKDSLAGPYGIISLDATRTSAFTAADLRLLEAFANTAAVAIDNARLHAEVQRLAVTDSLTALANPRAFERALAIEANRAARYGHPLSLIIMDIDAFKQYNDTYGHLAGNERLKAIGGILRDTVRDPDLPVRYGGEEFALLLPHTHKAGAVILAERIRELAQSAAPTAVVAGRPMAGYTLSLGVATLPTDALSADQLLLVADNAELEAKRSGKNRVCTAEPLVEN